MSSDNIKIDSRLVEQGDTFVAVKGTALDGHDYIHEAFVNGASRVVCEREPDGLSSGQRERLELVKDTTEELGRIAKKMFGDPSKFLEVFGVTGTNGKTTTVFLIDSILGVAGRYPGFISTVFMKTKGSELSPSAMTTPDVISLNRALSDMISDDKKSAVVEISSHALAQQRVWEIGLDSAVFTNISPEHLDYHQNMRRYLSDKAKIFLNLKDNGTAVLNIDDPLIEDLLKTLNAPRIVTFGVKEKKRSDIYAENIRLSSDGTEFDLVAGKLGTARIMSGFIGEHNVYNMLAAAGAVYNSGVNIEQIKRGFESSHAVPGRLEKLDSIAPFKVFIDYAHTPGALEKVMTYLRPLAEENLILVFGCGGDRDKTKRPVMGAIAGKICDRVFITNDNPRTEDPMSIITQIEKGMNDYDNYCIIEDRYTAIYEALKAAKEGDVVVVAGKGHEDYQIVGQKRLNFSDKEAAHKVLKKLNSEW